jgi:hypothetical protein
VEKGVRDTRAGGLQFKIDCPGAFTEKGYHGECPDRGEQEQRSYIV